MPINAFGGVPGSGKTYGVMEHVILPAISKGRFVLTNIEGLNTDLIYQYVHDHAPKGKIICIGHIRTCDRNDPAEDNFFPGEAALDKPMPVPSPDTNRVVGGDVVVIDEATRYWPVGDKVHKTHAYFFREHRHFSNEIGHTCDLVVIDPDISMLARSLKGKIEMSSITHKPKEIGLNKYVVNIYRGSRTTGKAQQTLGPYSFKKEIYSLYKSYSNEKAKEQTIDSRQNVLKNPRLWFYAIGLLLLASLSIFGVYRFFANSSISSSPSQKSPSESSVTVPPTPSRPSPIEQNLADGFSTELRIAGEAYLSGNHVIVLLDNNGRIRYENPQNFTGKGSLMVGNSIGQKVTTWTGVKSPERNEK